MTKSVVALGTLSAFNLGVADAVPMYFMNVPLSTIVMAFIGSSLYHAWSDEVREMSRRNMYTSVLFFAMLSGTSVALLPTMLGWEWYSVKLEGSLAFLLAVLGPNTIPVIKKLLPELVRKWFRLGEPKQEQRVTERDNENL